MGRGCCQGEIQALCWGNLVRTHAQTGCQLHPGKLWRREPLHGKKPLRTHTSGLWHSQGGKTGAGWEKASKDSSRHWGPSLSAGLLPDCEGPLETLKGASENTAGYEGSEQPPALSASGKKSSNDLLKHPVKLKMKGKLITAVRRQDWLPFGRGRGGEKGGFWGSVIFLHLVLLNSVFNLSKTHRLRTFLIVHHTWVKSSPPKWKAMTHWWMLLKWKFPSSDLFTTPRGCWENWLQGKIKACSFRETAPI